MKLSYFLLLFLVHLSLLSFPHTLHAMENDDLIEINGTKIARHFLEDLQEAQRLIHGLRILSFSRQATGTKDWTTEQRTFLKEMAIKYDRLTGKVKALLDQTLSPEDQHFAHTPPLFDEQGKPLQAEHLYFSYTTSKEDGTKKTRGNKSKMYEMCYDISPHIHEIAFKNVLFYIQTFMRYLLCDHYPTGNSASPFLSSSCDELNQECRKLYKTLQERTEPYLNRLGMILGYENKVIPSLTAVHLSDQSPSGFRAARRDGSLPEDQNEIHRKWLLLKLNRLQYIVECAPSQFIALLETLKLQGWLVPQDSIKSVPHVLLPCHPHNYVNFADWFRRGFGHLPQSIPYSINVLDEVRRLFREIWPSGVPKDGSELFNTRSPSSFRMLRIFCEIMEKRATLLKESYTTFYPSPLRDRIKLHLNQPQKRFQVQIKTGKRTKTVVDTYDYDVVLDHQDGTTERYSIVNFVQKWGKFKPIAQQLLVSLQLLEYIHSHVEFELQRLYCQPIERAFIELTNQQVRSAPLSKLRDVWQFETARVQDLNYEHVTSLTETYLEKFNLDRLIAYLISDPKGYVGIKVANLSPGQMDPSELFQEEHKLVKDITDVFIFYSYLVPSPAPKPKGKSKPVPPALGRIDSASLEQARRELTTKSDLRRAKEEENRRLEAERVQTAERERLAKEEERRLLERARLAYANSSESNEFPELGWAALTYYFAHLPKSWVALSNYTGPEEGPFIQKNFEQFFGWYWKNKGDFSEWTTPPVLESDKVMNWDK